MGTSERTRGHRAIVDEGLPQAGGAAKIPADPTRSGMPMNKLELYQPSQINSSEPPDLSGFGFPLPRRGRFVVLHRHAQSAEELEPAVRDAVAAHGVRRQLRAAGDTLQRISQMNTDPRFIDLLCGRRARVWDAILMSCGGNDLIEAVGSPPVDAGGQPVPPALRLLLTEAEWGRPSSARNAT
jgi:hypothetical protein